MKTVVFPRAHRGAQPRDDVRAAAIAANVVGDTIAMFQVLPGMAMGMGLTVVISRCVGAGDFEQILRQKSLDRRLYRAASQHGFGAPTFGARFAALFALARCRGDDDADRLVARRHDGAHLAANLHFARGFSRRRREVSDVGQRFVYVRVPHRAGVFFQSRAGAWDAGDLVRDVCGLGGSSPCFSRADTLTARRLNLKRFEQIIKAKIFMQI